MLIIRPVGDQLTRAQKYLTGFNCVEGIVGINFYICPVPSPITISPNIQSGEPVFTNTRVPVKNLFDYIKAGYCLSDFLDDFPSVSKEQAIQVIEHFENLLQFQPA